MGKVIIFTYASKYKCMSRRFVLVYFYLYWHVLIVLINVVHCDISISEHTYIVHTYHWANLASVCLSASMVHYFSQLPPPWLLHMRGLVSVPVNFPLYNFLQFCASCCSWQSFTLLYGWAISHYLYVLYTNWWSPRVIAALAIMNDFTVDMSGKCVWGSQFPFDTHLKVGWLDPMVALFSLSWTSILSFGFRFPAAVYERPCFLCPCQHLLRVLLALLLALIAF